MPGLSGEELAATLLQALPAGVAEAVLGNIPGDGGARLKSRLQGPPPTPEQIDTALAQFEDLLRIVERPVAAAGEYRPVAQSKAVSGPMEEIRKLPPEVLARAMTGESPSAVAVILSRLESALAGQVMKRLPADLRAEVAVRLTRATPKNPVLIDRLATVIAEKGRHLAEIPAELTSEERLAALIDIVRALPRAERTPLLSRLEVSDPAIAAQVRESLYRMEDLLRIPNRQLQTLLTELEVKKLAIALSGSETSIREKVTANMSSRAKTVLTEESELMGEVPASAVKEARQELLGVVRRLEEEGRVVIEE